MSDHKTEEYDIVIAGGGTAGCVIAGRLAKAQPDLQILVLEAGPPTQDLPVHTQPAQYLKHILPDSKTVKFYKGSVPSPHLGNRVPVVPTGACLGGGSSVNWMMYTRGARSDYDDWGHKFGNEGWDFESLKPFFDKCETYQIDTKDDNHGSSGPLKVSHSSTFPTIAQQWLETGSQMDGRPIVPDLQDFKTVDAYSRWAQWVDFKSGKRQDVPHNYIFPLISSGATNLHILTGATVNRVVFRGTKATGVEYSHNQSVRADGKSQMRLAVAKKLVVVSAGALGSPTILERSGIGASDILKKAGVKHLVDLPGIGENYLDHIASAIAFHMDVPDLVNKLVRDDAQTVKESTEQWAKDGTGPMATNHYHCGGKLRPHDSDLISMGDPFKERWEDFFQQYPDKPAIWCGAINALLLAPPELPLDLASMGSQLLYPASSGRIHIASSDPEEEPIFDPGYLSDPADLALLVWGYKHIREIARRMPGFRGDFVPLHPAFSAEGVASVGSAQGPVPIDAPKIVYSDEDEKALEKYIHEGVFTSWHSMGTCAMKHREQLGVVDSKLNVYGTQALKVADMSISPSNIGANTYSTALVIGEKAAALIAKELAIDNF